MEKTGRELGRETSADEILDNLHKRYRSHKNKGSYNTRLRNMQKAFEELMEVFDKKDLSLKENKEEFVKKCMSLTMECIKAHIFVATECQEPIQRKEMMFSASRSRRVSIIFGGFAPNSESAEVLFKILGNKTVMSGSISREKNDPSQSLQMIQRPLMTPDELKSLPKGNFIVSKTSSHPMRTKLKLFLKRGIIFEEPYEIEEKSARKVAYADKQEIEEEIIRRYMCCVDEEPESAEPNTVSRSGSMLQSQMNETVAKVRQALRTED